MNLRSFLNATFFPLEGVSTKYNIYDSDKYDVPVNEYTEETEYKFGPESLIVSINKIGMYPAEDVLSPFLLNKEIVAIYPENGELNIALGDIEVDEDDAEIL